MSRLGEWFQRLLLLATALIHLAPAVGVSGATALNRLYGLTLTDPNLLLLLQHRALLFALIGLPALIAIVRTAWRLPVMIAALSSVAGFLLLALMADARWPPAIRQVMLIDAGLLPFLIAGLVGLAWPRPVRERQPR